MTDTASATAPEPTEPTYRWARVEIFGHRHHTGRVREVEMVGTKMLMVEVPIDGDPEANGWQTLVYGGASIFSIAFTDEAAALAANRPWRQGLIATLSRGASSAAPIFDEAKGEIWSTDPEDE